MNSTENISSIDLNKTKYASIVTYISLINIIIGSIGNSICFAVFVSSRELRRMSSVVYLMYCSVMNILSLFEWNLDHFIEPYNPNGMESLSLANCRLLAFLQYFSLESSAYLLSFMCIDRFLIVISVPGSFSTRLPFSTAKSAHFWSILIITSIFSLHSLLLFRNGYYDPPEIKNLTINRTMSIAFYYQNPDFHCYSFSPTFSIYPLWDMIHLYLYTFIPFAIMITFNGLLITKTLLPNKKFNRRSTGDETNRERRRLTKSLLVITLTFLFMTMPANIAFGYFGSFQMSAQTKFAFNFLDCISFMHQSTLLINCFITNSKFRLIILDYFRRSKSRTNLIHPMSILRIKHLRRKF